MSKLEPENQFAPSEDRVGVILDRFGMRGTQFEAATSGIENTTLFVQSAGGRYVLRVYRQDKKSDNDIARELDFMTELREHGIPIPKVVPSKRGSPYEVISVDSGDWQCVLMEYTEGSHPQSYTGTLVDEMAIHQAKMHNLGEAYARQHDLPSKRKTLREVYVTSDLLADDSLDEYFREFLKRAKTFEIQLGDSLRRGFSHFDYDIENLLVDGDGHLTAILDFDDAKCLPLVVCLAYTLYDIQVLMDQPGQLLSRYLHRYQRDRPLTASEKEVLPQIMLFRHYVCAVFDIRLGSIGHVDLDQVVQQEMQLKEMKWDSIVEPMAGS